MAEPTLSLLREELKRAWHELRGAELSPARAAAAVAIGLFIGSQPIFGCHTPLVLTICLLLRLDAALAWVASNISNPFFAPFLISGEVQLGGYLHTGAPLPFDADVVRRTGIDGVVKYAFTGAPLVGLGLALAGAALVFGGMSVRRRFGAGEPRAPYRLPESAPAWWHATERVAGRYCPALVGPDAGASTPAERSRFHYVRVKLLMDPVTRMVADKVSGHLLDIGTGRGQMPLMLLELGKIDSAHGLDWDAAKIAAATRAANSPPLPATFERADAVEACLEPADTVLLIDVLHYLSLDQQDGLLDRAAAAVRPGGSLVLREADTERGWRSFVTLVEEKLFTALRFNRGARVRFRPAREIVERLTAAGLDCSVEPAWGSTPFANVLVVGKRRLDGADGPSSLRVAREIV